jgi:heme oxygenase
MPTTSAALRAATRDVHDDAERRLALPDSLRSRRDVDELLRRWHALAAELDSVLHADGPQGPPPVPPVRQVLEADLRRRGLSVAEAPGLALDGLGAPRRAGVAYVVAGAQLGVRQVARGIPATWAAGSGFLGDGGVTLRSMGDMRRWLDGWEAAVLDDLVDGARAAFGRAVEVLGAGPWSSPLPAAAAGEAA